MSQPTALLDRPLLWLSEKDHLCLRDLIEGGMLILGGLGSGKSSTSLSQFLFAMLRAGLGGLFCTVKDVDTPNYLNLIRAAGREKDVIVFDVKSGLRFDPLAYLWATGKGSIEVESIIDFFNILLQVGKQHVGVNNDRFWELAAEQAMRHAIHLIRLAQHRLSIVSIYRAIQSFPTYVGEQDQEDWQGRAFTAELMNAIHARMDSLTPAEWKDLEVAKNFVFFDWAALDPKTRGSIQMTFSGMADKFMFSPYREMFSSGFFDFTPEQVTHERKLIILNTAVLEHGRDTARLTQLLVKIVFQRAWLRHSFTPGCCHGAMLIQDEFQMLMSRFENHFVQVCRGSAIAPIFITQTILNLAEEMGENQPGPKSKAFLNNLSIKIAHNCTCPESARYLADVIGREYLYLDSYNANSCSDASSVGGTKHLAHIVEPIEFTRLLRPNGTNPNAEAIVYAAGRVFNATRTSAHPKGSNYLRVLFSRDIERKENDIAKS